jgi:hypothetical protein
MEKHKACFVAITSPDAVVYKRLDLYEVLISFNRLNQEQRRREDIGKAFQASTPSGVNG